MTPESTSQHPHSHPDMRIELESWLCDRVQQAYVQWLDAKLDGDDGVGGKVHSYMAWLNLFTDLTVRGIMPSPDVLAKFQASRVVSSESEEGVQQA